MPAPKCTACGKSAYPMESLVASGMTFHKFCFKCSVCKSTLNLKNFKAHSGQVYCNVHTPKEAHTQVADSVATRQALSAPKKKAEGLAVVHKGDAKTAPERADFHVNDTSADQSTESVAEASTITYEEHAADQSTENAPESSAVTYEEHAADQSTENAPESSGVTYEEHAADQSTENAPDASGVTYEEHAADQSTEAYGAGYGAEEGYAEEGYAEEGYEEGGEEGW